MKKKKPLPTIWEVSDELWKRMEPLILELDPPKENLQNAGFIMYGH